MVVSRVMRVSSSLRNQELEEESRKRGETFHAKFSSVQHSCNKKVHMKPDTPHSRSSASTVGNFISSA
jgi:hypothetical protein